MTISLEKKKRKPYPPDCGAGRPKSDIDWKMVDDLLEAGCSGAEIAANIGINPATLYDRCQADHNMMFSQYSQEKQQKGDSLLRKAQFDKAMIGDNTLLIWLGKCRLKQKEHQDEVIKQEVESKFNQLMQQMEKDKANTPQHNVNESSSPETA
jgi:hypothetical protein